MNEVSFRKIVTLLMVGVSPLLLQGCEAVAAGTAGTYINKKFDEKPPLTLMGYNYAAADMLATQSRNMISTQTVFETIPLVNIGEKPMGNGLGRVIIDQVGGRFTQLGYQVVPDTSLMGKREASSKVATMGGTYAVVGKKILINLRLIQAGGGKMLGSYDYEMPITREVRELTGLKTELYDFF
jgi:hypothetical protein